MDEATFAVDDGYPEAILRGLRSSFLTENQYTQMKGCNNLNELKTFLEETDYGSYLQSNEGQELTIPALRTKLKAKLAGEFDYISAQSVPPLTNFLYLMSTKYMIENVVNMIEGIKNNVDPQTLLASTDPLGYFPEMKNIKVLEGDDYAQLYRDVLIDTPVGPYFMRFLEESMEGLVENRTTNDVLNLFKDMKAEFIRTSLKKMWLEDFYEYCSTELNSTSQEMLIDLLKFEADFKTIQVAYNTMNNKDLNTTAKIITTRKQLSPTIGYLYPDSEKGIFNSTTIDMLREAVRGVENYKDILKDAPDPQKKEDYNFATRTLEDIMYDEEIRRFALAYDQSSQYAVFYAYLKLKEQEIRNIVWLAEMITRKLDRRHAGFKKIIVPFSHFQGNQRN